MAKSVIDVLADLKGKDKVNTPLTGKGPFSAPGFSAYVAAMANDKTYKVPIYNKSTGKTEPTSVHELFVQDAKKTAANAGYPQKAEAGVYNDSEIATNGISQAIKILADGWLETGRKFPLLDKPNRSGYVYLQPVKGGVKESKIRDMKSGQPIGTTTTTTKDHVAVRAKSQVPAALTSKVRKDLNGKVVPPKK
jgi:hypothetical protein